MKIETLHHVSLAVSDLERSKRFYGDILGLQEIPRPPFDFAGAWYRLGDRQLHLIVAERPTFRERKGIDSHDVHFAIRVRSYGAALEYLRSKGYRGDAADDRHRMKENRPGRAGFPQIYILDPDRHVIEINAERMDV